MSSTVETGSNILKAGDYKLHKIIIRSLVSKTEVNISALLSFIEIYEDLFSPYITAKIHMSDGLNIAESLPIRGQELIDLEFKPDIEAIPTVRLRFRVYKLDSQEIDQNGKLQKYTLHAMSEGGYENPTHYCGYALQGSVSEMVYSVFKKHFDSSVWTGKLDIEQTKDNYSLVLPKTFDPFRAISWLTNRATNANASDYSPFLFYEGLDGYHFRSLSSIISDRGRNKLQYFYNTGNLFVGDDVASASPQSVGSTVLPARYHKIQSMTETSRFDMMSNFMGGAISSSLLVHDLLRKEARASTFLEGEIFPNIKKTGKYPHFQPTDPLYNRFYKSGAIVDYVPSTPYTVHTQNNNIIENSAYERLHLKRKFHMNSILNGQKVIIDVFGDSRRKVGDIINLSVPNLSADAHLKDVGVDKNMSGDYMITAIRHLLGTAYTCRFELTKSFMGV